MMIFRSLPEALRAGFQVEQAIPEGYLVCTRTAAGYARAIVELKK